MSHHKPYVSNSDGQNIPSEEDYSTSEKIVISARPDELIEVFLSTQPYRSDQQIWLNEKSFNSEATWLYSFNKDALLKGDCLRLLRVAYHAQYYAISNREVANDQRGKPLDILCEVGRSAIPMKMLQRLLVLCELPLVILRSQVSTDHQLADWGTIVDRLTLICEEGFDGEGMIASADVGDFADVIASLVRIIRLAAAGNSGQVLPKCVLNQFQWGVRQLLVTSSGDGHPFGEKFKHLSRDFVSLVLKLGGDPSDVRLAHHLGLLSDSSTEFTQELAVAAKRPESSFHSEWAQVAVLRSGWGRKRRELGISAIGGEVKINLQSHRNPVLQGLIESTTEVGGVTLQPTGNWVETCWQSDNDADYLELELQLNEDWRIQRQFCVSRRSGAVLVADVVLGNVPSDIRHTIKFAPAPGVLFKDSNDGRELVVKAGNLSGLILPVGLSEWSKDRSESVCGELSVSESLKLVTSGKQLSALYCPLFFALTPKASEKQFTWRRLLVVKNLNDEPPDQATAIRIQVGGRQWLLYRSLAERESRTFMGQNFTSEFVFGEFLLDGKLKPYVEIG